jgi:H/ACA ribonucleoprotein complex subunit 4
MTDHLLPSQHERTRLIKVMAKTNPHYGKRPEERSVRDLLSNCYINLDKPAGPTSHQVDSWVKEILHVEKVGHHGTLDPQVTGVLPIAVGDAARALQVLLLAGKEYVGLMKLHKQVDPALVRKTMEGFVGEVTQMPPVRSAVKRVKRKRTIYYIDVMEIQDTEVLFTVGCEAGTYIRTLCVDIGKKLGVGAQLMELRRTKVGHITEQTSVKLQDLKDAYMFYIEDHDETRLKQILRPMEDLLGSIPKVVIRDSAVDALCHGANLAVPGIVEIDSGIKRGDTAAAMTLKNEGVALVTMALSTEEALEKDQGIAATLERVLMNKGSYPSVWKK